MKYSFFFVILSFLSCNPIQKTTDKVAHETGQASPIPYARTITEEDLKTHLFIYASDAFEGRETGSEGQKKAVAYLKEQYEKLNIEAAKGNGDYFQPVPLEIKRVPTGSISLNGRFYTIGDDFVTFSNIETQENEFVYANYGIETKAYSDYTNMEVKDKVVLVRFGEPMRPDGTYRITGTNKPSVWSNFDESLDKRLELAAKKGAKAILIIEGNNYPRLRRRFNYMARSNRDIMTLSAQVTDALPSIFIGGDLAKDLVKLVSNLDLSANMNASLELGIKNASKKVASENVVALIKGTELPNEYVVVSSHLDHIGINKKGQINNGADDDGSGTVALLEMAQAFKKAADQGNGPKRSIVFLHVTGEEKGLLGSSYYTDVAPLFPLEQTVANLNIDMIGRIDPKRKGDRNYLYLIGSDKLSTELHELSEDINKKYTQMELDYTYNDVNDPNRFYYRSDHYNFAKNNIPVIFYFNGTHDDYHRPGDTPDKINYDLLKKRTQLVFYTAWEIANREKRLVVDKMEK